MNTRTTGQFHCEYIGTWQSHYVYFYRDAELAPWVVDYPDGTYRHFTTQKELIETLPFVDIKETK